MVRDVWAYVLQPYLNLLLMERMLPLLLRVPTISTCRESAEEGLRLCFIRIMLVFRFCFGMLFGYSEYSRFRTTWVIRVVVPR